MPKILLDPGHGQYGNKGVLGYYEGTQMWHFGQYLADEFRALGWTVGITRPKITDDPSLATRGQMAKGYDLFISLHSNAPGSSSSNPASIRGVSIYDSVADELDYLEVPLVAEIARTMNTPNRGVKHWESTSRANKDYFGVLRNATAAGCPDAMLIEHGYHTNETDAKWLLSHDNLKRLAKAESSLIDRLWKQKHGGDMLKKGDKSDAVKKWQSRLLEAGYKMVNNGKEYGADGSFGQATVNGTNNFKKVVGLPQDGQVDDLTWDAMVGKLKGVDQSQITALNAKVKAAENAKLVAENKLAQVRQAVNIIKNA